MSSMNNQKKLVAAGFNLYRCDLVGTKVWKCKKPGSWIVASKHDTQAATTRAFNELLKDDKNLAL